MPYTIYRKELDGTETVIGCTNDPLEAAVMIDSDKDNIDFDTTYRWHHEPDRNAFGGIFKGAIDALDRMVDSVKSGE